MLHDCGYLIMAINSEHVDYRRCADQLAESLLRWHPDSNITIVTRENLPHGDLGGQHNDWQLYDISPYHETIKLEADMLVCSDIHHWWSLFRHRDMVISQGCRDFYDRLSTSRHYRKTFDDNDLPDVYNAVTYWRVSRTAKEFFRWCRLIWQYWPRYRGLLKFSPESPDCDLVYAMAAIIVGVEKVTLPGIGPSITHMKQHIIGTQHQDWTKELVWEYHDGILKINTVAQRGAFHYLNKDWNPNGCG